MCGGGDVANELALGKAMFKAVIALKERTLQEWTIIKSPFKALNAVWTFLFIYLFFNESPFHLLFQNSFVYIKLRDGKMWLMS